MTEERKNELRDNYLRVIERIENAKQKRGGGEVRLLAATKTVDPEEVVYLIETFGLDLCGENRAQEFTAKYDAVTGAGARLDFIGHLQTNKVKYIAGKAGLIHSLDSVKLAEEIQRVCEKRDVVQDVLVEVNIGMEESKSGIAGSEVRDFLEQLSCFDRIRVCGMMTMAPKCENTSEFRKYFRESYTIFVDNFGKKLHNMGEHVLLSMGMSDSFECAIEEGSNLVRVGSAIFGSRKY